MRWETSDILLLQNVRVEIKSESRDKTRDCGMTLYSIVPCWCLWGFLKHDDGIHQVRPSIDNQAKPLDFQDLLSLKPCQELSGTSWDILNALQQGTHEPMPSSGKNFYPPKELFRYSEGITSKLFCRQTFRSTHVNPLFPAISPWRRFVN